MVFSGWRSASASCAAAAALLAACGGTASSPSSGPDSGGTGHQPAAQMTALSVTPAAPALPAGRAQQLVATATWSDGSATDVTALAIWSVSDGTVASISPGGLATGRKPGVATLTASYRNVSATAALTVGAPVPVAVVISPASANLAKGRTQRFAATGLELSDGTTAPLDCTPRWTSSTPAVASVDASGLVTALEPGSATISASCGAVFALATLAVGAAQVVSVTVTPANAIAVRGLSARFQAIATLSDGTTQDVTAQATWAASGAAAGVQAGLVTAGNRGGRATVRAEVTGAPAAEATLTVLPQRVAFATSIRGTGDMGTWPGSGGQHGLAGADAVCEARAAAAGLPGTFAAWLSDDITDAYCHVQGLTGRRYMNCGEYWLPVDAGPWVRTDGAPYADSVAGMTTGRVHTPLRFDEAGRALPPATWLRDGTNADGSLSNSDPCSEWSSAIDNLTVGGIDTDHTWAWGEWSGCSPPASLICLEVGPGTGPELPATGAAGNLVFVTSVTGAGNLSAWPDAAGASGLDAADVICRARASAAGLARAARFKAWLSSGTVDASARISGNGPWVRLDGIQVAATKADLVAGNLFTAIAVDENGNPAAGGVWTGGVNDGVHVPFDCSGWSDDSYTGQGGEGVASSAAASWTSSLVDRCFALDRLYCFEE
jgi:hypothetical protein